MAPRSSTVSWSARPQEWSNVLDARQKRLQALLRAAVEPAQIHQQGGVTRSWMAVRGEARQESVLLGELVEALRRISSSLRLMKGEIKQSLRRFTDHRLKLEAEMGAADLTLQRAIERRTRAESALDVEVEVSQSARRAPSPLPRRSQPPAGQPCRPSRARPR